MKLPKNLKDQLLQFAFSLLPLAFNGGNSDLQIVRATLMKLVDLIDQEIAANTKP